MTPDLLAMARTAVSASTASTDDRMAVFYVASARIALASLAEEMRALEVHIAAREDELLRRCGGPLVLTTTKGGSK
jgi:hypothetical protein